jgi:hypothetical protein
LVSSKIPQSHKQSVRGLCGDKENVFQNDPAARDIYFCKAYLIRVRPSVTCPHVRSMRPSASTCEFCRKRDSAGRA